MPDGRIELSWPADATGFVFESATDPGVPSAWGPPPEPVSPDGVRTVVRIVPMGAGRYFRLRSAGGALLSVAETSPSAGEGGISVNRESVFTFSQPLAAGSVISSSALHAEALGRRLLGRIELSADRRQVSLFNLEPMPGGARVRVTLEGDNLTDEFGRAPDLDGDGAPGGAAVLQFDTASTVALAHTAVVGRVLTSEGGPGGVEVPIPGVTITVDGREQDLRTVTDANGEFRLEPCPAGRFFVNVDGRTSPLSNWPGGAYYPLLGKAWEAVAGRTNNPAGGTGVIFLPRIAAGTLQPVSATAETRITFPAAVIQAQPELAGVEILVPPNGLYADNGARGGLVGLAPVASDRLPEPLPAGLNHAIDISIQTSGPQNFDRPVPAKFPNLPDPVTGETLPPGAKTALWSFNHDTGRWEMQGSMTISADGKFAVTDPGVGIRQPGWHGVSSGSSGGGGPGGGGGCPPGGGGGGVLPEGSYSGGGGECECSPELSENQRNQNLCMKKASACALKCYEECGTSGRPEGILDLIGFAKDCKEGADCSLRCKQEGERCKDYWFSCMSSGMRRVAPLGPAPMGAGGDDPAADEAQRILADIEALAAIQDQTLTILSHAPTVEELSAADRAQLETLLGQLQAILGPRTVQEWVAYRLDLLSRMVLQSSSADDLFPPVSGYYALEDLETGLVRRGRTELRGYLTGVVLRPNATYRIRLLLGPTLLYHDTTFVSAGAGQPTHIPYGNPIPLASVDADADGIPADAEFVLGTSEAKADTDVDGVSDLEELRNGTNPSDGASPFTGVIAGVDTPGKAVDVAIQGNLALVADSAAGVAVVDISDPQRPSVVQQLDTPGNAVAVAIDGIRGAVADGSGGLVLLGLGDPASVTLDATFRLSGSAQAVALDAGFAYCGTSDGTVAVADLQTATLVANVKLPGGPAVSDLVVQAPFVYVWAAAQLHVLSFDGDDLLWLRSVDSGAAYPTIEPVRRRLRPSATLLYGTHLTGVAVFDAGTPGQPTLRVRNDTTQTAWKDMVPLQGDLGVAADGIQFSPGDPQDVSLYSLGAEGAALSFLASFATPGQSHAVALAKGLAFVADGEAGLEVLQLFQLDTFGVPPTVELAADFPLNPPQLETGQPARLVAVARDDVRVREVEFYVDEELKGRDTTWPFELSFVGPPRLGGKTSFTLKARAVDTAGSEGWSGELLVELLEDRTAPRVVAVAPQAGSVLSVANLVMVRFNEPLAAASITLDRVRLTSSGPDLVFGTPDDQVISGVVSYDPDAFGARFEAPNPFANGRYRVEVSALTDLAGNAMAGTFTSEFWVAPGGPGGDPDGDGLTNEQESLARTNPFAEDTDEDGWADEVEVNDGKDPLDSASQPRRVVVAGPAVEVRLGDLAEVLPAVPGPIVGRPEVLALILPSEETVAPGPFIARPPVQVFAASPEDFGPAGPFVGRPPVGVTLMPDETTGGLRPVVGRPPVSVFRAP